MPRTTTLECPGCPPLRALTFDELGLIKVIEARGKQGRAEPKLVERWGDLDSSKGVLAASLDDRKSDPFLDGAERCCLSSDCSPLIHVPSEVHWLLAVARRNGTIEVLNPLNGDLRFSVTNSSNNGVQPEDDPVAGLHLLARKNLELASRSFTLLTCTTKGSASIRSFELTKPAADVTSTGYSRTWSVGAGGNILCSKVDGSENYFLLGGKHVEMNVWDLDSCAKIWTAKPPPKNTLGIFTPTWFTSATFLSRDDHRKFVAGTNSHEVRLYDISAQRRPVISFEFRETAIKSVAEDLNGYTIYVGNGSGDLASFDIRTGKLLGCFLGKCSGSIRSIARHPDYPVIASCGLDSYLRLWNVKTWQLLSAVYMKQPLSNVLFYSNFADEEAEVVNPPANRLLHGEHIAAERDEDETPPVKRKKSKEKKGNKKEAKAKSGNNEACEEDGGKKLKSKKSSKRLKREDVDELS
ncbi:hypothetical protein DVH24_008547 [Malus domestica]|uniref:Uncharacterized protein n=1 Tax=Malus domestica TaxID=3750 RepID=A0A498JMF4_MALDO|nr:hypothetical protein DVH24_008547 [Malus domestica]